MSDTATPTVPTDSPKPQPPAPATAPPAQRDAATDTPLGEAGLKALREERAARERIEQAMKDQRAALLKAFGVDEEKPGGDIVATLQEQVKAIQKASLVDRLARRHGITDDADVEILSSASDEASMARLAQRLTANATPAAVPAPPTPAPDPSQGAQPPTPEAMSEAEYAAFYPNP